MLDSCSSLGLTNYKVFLLSQSCIILPEYPTKTLDFLLKPSTTATEYVFRRSQSGPFCLQLSSVVSFVLVLHSFSWCITSSIWFVGVAEHAGARASCGRELKPGVHTNDFAPIYGRRATKLGHASLTTVFPAGRLRFQPILWENLESPVIRSHPITTAVITDAFLNTRWHHGAYMSPK